MAAPLEYVRPELFNEAVDRHHRSYVSAVLGGPLARYVAGQPAR
jgi:hypothetical protein